VRGGQLAAQLLADAEAGYPRLRASRRVAASHGIEEVGARLRALSA
jgi:ketol-acid reductoisomerase